MRKHWFPHTYVSNTRNLAHKSGRTQEDITGVLPCSCVTAKILTFRHIYKTHVPVSPHVLCGGWKECEVISHGNFSRRLGEEHGILWKRKSFFVCLSVAIIPFPFAYAWNSAGRCAEEEVQIIRILLVQRTRFGPFVPEGRFILTWDSVHLSCP